MKDRGARTGLIYRRLFLYPAVQKVGVALTTSNGRVLESLWLGVLEYTEVPQLIQQVPLDTVFVPNGSDTRRSRQKLIIPEGTRVSFLDSRWRGYKMKIPGDWRGQTLIQQASKMALYHTHLYGTLSKLEVLPLTQTLIEQRF
jgi:hypothetical protein